VSRSLGACHSVWDATTFTKNRDRLLDGDIATAFFAEVLAEAKAADVLSDEHFTVDGTLGSAGEPEEFPRRDTRPSRHWEGHSTAFQVRPNVDSIVRIPTSH
jgi:hypothetical protein